MQEIYQAIVDFLPFKSADIAHIFSLSKYVFVVYMVGLFIEYFIPAQKGQSADKIRFNVIYTINFIVINTLLFRFLVQVKEPVIEFLGGPYLTITFGSSVIQQILSTLVYLLIFDFFYYWFHRWQHQSRVFWSQHQLHHSETALNVTTGNRHHWLEDSLRIFIIIIPMATLVKVNQTTTGIVWSFFMLWGYFIHLNVKMNFGPLTRVFGGPQVHRIHHSNLKPHLDKNFAAFFPIYDILFGTFYLPEKGEYPTTGLYKSNDDMNNLKSANFYPFMYVYRVLKKSKS